MKRSDKPICPGSYKQMVWSEERHNWVCAVCKFRYARNATSKPGTPHVHVTRNSQLAAARPAYPVARIIPVEAPVVEQAPVRQLPVAAMASTEARFAKAVEGMAEATEYAKQMLDEIRGLFGQAS